MKTINAPNRINQNKENLGNTILADFQFNV